MPLEIPRANCCGSETDYLTFSMVSAEQEDIRHWKHA